MKKILISIITVLALGAYASKAIAINYNLEAIRLYNMGLEQYKKGAYNSSIDCFKEAIEIQKNFDDAYYNLAIVYDFVGRTAEAANALELLLKQSPEDFSASLKLAQIYHKKGETNKAITLAEKIPVSAAEYDKARDLVSRINTESSAKIKHKNIEETEIAAKVLPEGKNILGINSPSGITGNAGK